MEYHIIRETKKALLIENVDEVSFWIQRRWMRADGTLTPAGAAAENAAYEEIENPQEQQEPEAVKILASEVLAETEKAVRVSAFVEYSGVDAQIRIWLPKSQLIERDGLDFTVPAWLAEAKASDHAVSGTTPYFVRG